MGATACATNTRNPEDCGAVLACYDQIGVKEIERLEKTGTHYETNGQSSA
jgi:hypothetical protein